MDVCKIKGHSSALPRIILNRSDFIRPALPHYVDMVSCCDQPIAGGPNQAVGFAHVSSKPWHAKRTFGQYVYSL
jgi:hypothetical protein